MSGDFLHSLGSLLPGIGDGVRITVEMAVGGAILAFVIAVVLGLGARVSNVVVRGASRTVIEFFRGTSLVVQLFWIYYVLPQLGVEWPAIWSAIVALGLNYGAYGAEVVRGSINSVPPGQWEATTALSMGRTQRMWRVVFPQAWPLMIPSLTNLLIQLLKGTAIVSFISMHDLMYWVDKLRINTGSTLLSYSIGLVLYFVIAYLFTLVMNALEVHAKSKVGRGRGLRGLFRSPSSTDATVVREGTVSVWT